MSFSNQDLYEYDAYEDDEDEIDVCLHGVPWSEECPECDWEEDEADWL